MSKVNERMIDSCSEFIEAKNYHYLAKEGLVVSYVSSTGRDSDYEWNKQTITETLRIIKAIHMSYEDAQKVKEGHLVTAFQELGRVYEYGVKSRHNVQVGLFNYNEHSKTSVADDAIRDLAETLHARGFFGVRLMEVTAAANLLLLRLKLDITAAERRDLTYKHFESLGYIVKTGAERPTVNKTKVSCIMMPGITGSKVKHLTVGECKEITLEIYNRIK